MKKTVIDLAVAAGIAVVLLCWAFAVGAMILWLIGQ